MQMTKNIGLKKPAQDDFYDIQEQNDNMDIIDAKIKELQETGNEKHAKKTATENELGHVKVKPGNGLKNDNGTVSMGKGTDTEYGAVKISDNYDTESEDESLVASQKALYEAYNDLDDKLVKNNETNKDLLNEYEATRKHLILNRNNDDNVTWSALDAFTKTHRTRLQISADTQLAYVFQNELGTDEFKPQPITVFENIADGTDDITQYATEMNNSHKIVRCMNVSSSPYNNDDNDFWYEIIKLSNDWIRIIAYDVRSSRIFSTGKLNGVWQGWQEINTSFNANSAPWYNVASAHDASGMECYFDHDGVTYDSGAFFSYRNKSTGETTMNILSKIGNICLTTPSEKTAYLNDQRIATDGDINTLKSNFQAGVDSIYNAIVAQGTTPASNSLGDVKTGISTLSTVYNLGGGTSFNIKAKFPNLYSKLTSDNFVFVCTSSNFSAGCYGHYPSMGDTIRPTCSYNKSTGMLTVSGTANSSNWHGAEGASTTQSIDVSGYVLLIVGKITK